MRIETEKVYKLVKKYGGVLTDDRHFMDDVDQLLETAHNSDYAKSKSCANCSKLYQCDDVRKHPEWHCENYDFA